MWFWFLNHTLLSLLTLRKSTTSALIIGFSETFWFAPAFVGPYGCDLYWRKRLPFTHKHTQTHDWSHMAKVNSGLVDSNRFFNRGRILLKMVFGVLTAQNVPAVVKISGSHFVSPVYTYIYLKLFDFSAQWLVHTMLCKGGPAVAANGLPVSISYGCSLLCCRVAHKDPSF